MITKELLESQIRAFQNDLVNLETRKLKTLGALEYCIELRKDVEDESASEPEGDDTEQLDGGSSDRGRV